MKTSMMTNKRRADRLTEHSNPRKTFGVNPKKVRYEANEREAEEEIHSYKQQGHARSDQQGHTSSDRSDLHHLQTSRPPSNLLG